MFNMCPMDMNTFSYFHKNSCLISDMYVHDIQTGITVSDREPNVVSERAATAYVDGCNLLGPVVGDFCMQLAISKAKSAGVGFVSAKSWLAACVF